LCPHPGRIKRAPRTQKRTHKKGNKKTSKKGVFKEGQKKMPPRRKKRKMSKARQKPEEKEDPRECGKPFNQKPSPKGKLSPRFFPLFQFNPQNSKKGSKNPPLKKMSTKSFRKPLQKKVKNRLSKNVFEGNLVQKLLLNKTTPLFLGNFPGDPFSLPLKNSFSPFFFHF